MNFLKKTLIIAEIACSHEGDFLKAKKLVDCAFNAKVDAIKFQKFTANELYESSHKSFQMAKNLEFTNWEWKKLVNYAKKKNLLVFADVYGLKSAKFMSTLKIDGFKIHSTDMTNPEILNYFSKINLPILLSTAGCNLNEIHEALKILDKNKKNLTLMHGFQGYPTKILDINLRRLIELQNNFGINVGLMDHISGDSSMSTVIPLLGICFGATIIEKHITLDRDQKGTDYHSALNPNEFKKLVNGLYFITLSVFSALLPEDESTKVKNLSALVLLSSLIPTKDAAPAAKLPELTHLVSVPSDERT